MSCRLIPSYDFDVLSISEQEAKALQALALTHGSSAWDLSDASPLQTSEKALVKKFKAKVKEHLFFAAQGSYCCYCGAQLTDHQMTYDAEHCIAKDGKSALVFNLKNIAIACKACNGHKGTLRTRVYPLDDDIDEVSEGSDKYLIVHPHFDRWGAHLSVDKYGRVVPKDGVGLTKGWLTIQAFQIHKKNAMALADHFDLFLASASERKDWQHFYVQLMSAENPSRSRKFKAFLTRLISVSGDARTKDLRKILGL